MIQLHNLLSNSENTLTIPIGTVIPGPTIVAKSIAKPGFFNDGIYFWSEVVDV